MSNMLLIAEAAEDEENVLLPAGPDLFWGAICFVILLLVFWKFVLPRLQKVLAERTAAIEGGMQRADDAQAEAQAELERYRALLVDARKDAGRLVEEARERGATAMAEMRAEGARIKEEIIASGHAQIDADRKQAQVVLRQEVGKIATELASRIVGEVLEDEVRQRRIVDRFLDDLEAKANAQTTEQVR